MGKIGLFGFIFESIDGVVKLTDQLAEELRIDQIRSRGTIDETDEADIGPFLHQLAAFVHGHRLTQKSESRIIINLLILSEVGYHFARAKQDILFEHHLPDGSHPSERRGVAQIVFAAGSQHITQALRRIGRLFHHILLKEQIYLVHQLPLLIISHKRNKSIFRIARANAVVDLIDEPGGAENVIVEIIPSGKGLL